jgi:hypothetical protein
MVGKFNDGVPTKADCIACEHPDLKSEYGMDGL